MIFRILFIVSFAIIFDPVFSSEYQASRLFPSASHVHVTFKAFSPGNSSLGTHVPGKIGFDRTKGSQPKARYFQITNTTNPCAFFLENIQDFEVIICPSL